MVELYAVYRKIEFNAALVCLNRYFVGPVREGRILHQAKGLAIYSSIKKRLLEFPVYVSNIASVCRPVLIKAQQSPEARYVYPPVKVAFNIFYEKINGFDARLYGIHFVVEPVGAVGAVSYNYNYCQRYCGYRIKYGFFALHSHTLISIIAGPHNEGTFETVSVLMFRLFSSIFTSS